jgi:hypothetical protein
VPASEEQVFGEGLSPALEAALSRLSALEREVVALRDRARARRRGRGARARDQRDGVLDAAEPRLQKLEKEVSAGVAA